MAALIRKITQFSKKEIDNLWKKARRVVRHDGLHLLQAPKSLSEIARILMVIPRRVGSAPARNKIRRQIRHLFYENKLYEGDTDWIIIVKPAATKLTFQEIQNLLLKTPQKAK